MAVVTKGDEGNQPMADDRKSGGPDPRNKKAAPRQEDDPVTEQSEPIEYQEQVGPATPPAALGGGFFHIYKSGQGYWTRMGTVAGIALVVALIARLIYTTLKVYSPLTTPWIVGIVAGLVVAAGIAVWYVLNKPGVVDFMIATESEMKKVNWTSRKDLVGSTKVVIIFMFLIAALLFLLDVFFGYLFYMISVLKQKPF